MQARAGLCALVFALAAWPTLRALAASELDPFAQNEKIASLPVKDMLSGESICRFDEVPVPLSLFAAVERALCNDPKSRQAWADAKLQAATVGARMAAYLPSLDVSLNASRQHNKTQIREMPFLDSNTRPTVYAGVLRMSLTILDFGQRGALLDQARALLAAANASHDAALQVSLLDASNLYFAVLTAHAALRATQEAENTAQKSYLAAKAKYEAGVGGLTDQLQASTAFAQAHLDRVSAEGHVKDAQGSLSLAMGLPVSTPLTLVSQDSSLFDTNFLRPADELIEQSRQNHPRLLALRAELGASEANIQVVRAEGRPNVALVGEISLQKQKKQMPSLGYPNSDVMYNNRNISLQVDVPLFEGFGRGYRISAAQAQAEGKAADLERLEREIALEVWKNYQLLETESANLKASKALVANAGKSLEVASGRYRAGVGSMIELLNAQDAAAKAELRRIQSIADWNDARLKLAASIGTIGLWAIR